MTEGARRLGCGNCGYNQFAVYDLNEQDHHRPRSLHVECLGCKSVTVVLPTEPRLVMAWGDRSDGILTPLR